MLKQSTVETVIEKVVGKVVNSSSFGDGFFALAEKDGGLQLVAVTQGESPLAERWKAEKSMEQDGFKVYFLSMNANNWALVRRYIKWTAPTACGAKGISIGIKCPSETDRGMVLGDFQNRQVRPVLADATPGALAEAGRNFLNLTDEATKAVFAANWRNGYGANAAGLTTEEDVVKALLYGYSMIGFDPSDKIVLENTKLSDEELTKKFEAFPMEFQAAVNASYLNVEFQVGEHKIAFTPEEVHRIVLEYGEVIMHVQFIYNSYLKSTPWPIDFELCIRRAGRALTPQEHYLIANELERNGVKITSFLFDLQDGISDGDLALHGEIANSFEYRLSLDNADRDENNFDDFLKVSKHRAHFKVRDIGAVKALLKKI
mgnify:FL=1